MYHIHENLIYSELSDGTLGLGNVSIPNTDKNAYSKDYVAPKHLIIPPFINNKKVAIILDRALIGLLGVKSVDLPYTLKEIKEYGLCDLYDLRSLVIPASVEILGKHAISSLIECKSLIFEAGSKLYRVDYGAFDNCGAEEIALPPLITTYDSDTFFYCKRLKRVYICSENVFNNNTKTFDEASKNAVVYAPMGYKGEFFGGKRVIKIKDCCLIMHKQTRCTFKHSTKKLNFNLHLMIITLSIH